jgi:hypothetical protein
MLIDFCDYFVVLNIDYLKVGVGDFSELLSEER